MDKPFESASPGLSPSHAPSQIHTKALLSPDEDEIRALALELINGSHPGILGTVDEKGYPVSRWMATFSFDNFPLFFTLTSPESRKVAQISAHPQVNWTFFNQDLSLIVSLKGRARILTDTPTLKRVWKQIHDKSLAYFLKNYSEGLGFVVIETRVETLECASPKYNARLELDPQNMTATSGS